MIFESKIFSGKNALKNIFLNSMSFLFSKTVLIKHKLHEIRAENKSC